MPFVQVHANAIVATLAYLAIQAHQANNMLIGNSRQAALAADIQLLSNTLDNPEVIARIAGVGLSLFLLAESCPFRDEV